jgi:hypothetical protein
MCWSRWNRRQSKVFTLRCGRMVLIGFCFTMSAVEAHQLV